MKKIYVAMKSGINSGGITTLNQFIAVLEESNIPVYRYFVDNNTTVEPEDCDTNMLVVPETLTYVLKKFSRIKKVIWWLSLDFYLQDSNAKKYLYSDLENYLACVYAACIRNQILPLLRPIYFMYRLVKDYLPSSNISCLSISEILAIDAHFYNVVYERQFLERIRAKGKLMYQCGPIDSIYFTQRCVLSKEDLVIYNPQKADFYTFEVIDEIKNIAGDSIKCIPLCDMTKEELLYNYNRAKVYMDFGFFPGPERMPREAVICGCNIIVSLRGAAYNYEDVPIYKQYKVKYSYKKDVIRQTAFRVVEMVKNYYEDYKDFEEYREKVSDQKRNFEKNVLMNMRKLGVIK